MDIDITSWMNLLIRWFHVILGITWIGQTYLFNWLERRMEALPAGAEEEGVSGQLWMVHSGGFFKVQKLTKPQVMPTTLHWFKWEAGLTWVSGIGLLILVYYHGGLLLDYDSPLSQTMAIALSIAFILGGWLAYNILLRLPFTVDERAMLALSFASVIGAAYLLDMAFSSRATYMHIGAMFGTIMGANVRDHILPAQRQMLAATEAGEQPDMTLAKKASRASKHNTYMSVPLVFVMLSSHFPTITYGNDLALPILGGLVLFGWGGAKLMRG
ncbi:MAG: urate hydroxylase PuuD [Candidatus Marinimicrobia bacterium]|nr:urate hydroxylase PuuD [Candidatus Neomarinimicrobiota bacterium]